MKKGAKKWVAAAAVLVVLGAILFVGVLEAYDWDFTKLGTDTYVTNTYEAKGEFEHISVDTETTDLEVVLAEDGICKVVCVETEKVKHSVDVQNGTLVIDTVDTRKWYEHIGVSFRSPRMTVFLPQAEYASLTVETDTGDVTVSKELSFGMLYIDGDTADVNCFASVSGTAEIDLSTGDITVDSVAAGQLSLETTTGDIRVDSVAVEGMLSVETDTGDVTFSDSDASQIFVETSTGDVTGTLLSEKMFVTETATGSIRVPKTTSGGKCEIRTSTGDIEISIK